MTQTLSIIIAAALVNNLVLIQLLGVSSLLYGTRRLARALEFALFSFIVLFIASTLNLILYRLVLAPLGLEFLRLVLFAGVSALLTSLLLRLLEDRLPLTARQQAGILFLAGGNSAVLGVTLLGTTGTLGLAQGIAYCFGAALGYSLVIAAFAAVRLRLQSADVPAAFRGGPIELVTAGLFALSLLGFAGLS